MTPNDIMSKRFDKAAMGGYKAEDVNSFMLQISDYMEQLLEERDDLERKLTILAEKLEEYRADEESLRSALIGAQKLGDSVVRDSKSQAEKTLGDAQAEADRVLSEAKAEAETIVTTAQKSIEAEKYTLNRMQMEVAKFKGQMLNHYRKHIEMLNALPSEVNDVPEIPDALKRRTSKDASQDDEQGASTAEDVQAAEPEAIDWQQGAELDETTGAIADVMEEVEGEAGEEAFPQRKRSKFGPLQFGDGYKLNRDE